MAWNAAHWTITRSSGNIRYIGPDHSGAGSYVTVIDFHRELQKFADDASSAGDDELDITDENPSARSTDNIVTLLGNYNIDDNAAEHIYDGSIIQGSGDTQTYYDGIVNYGNSTVLIQIIQDGKVLSDAWWNDNGGAGLGGLNPDAAQGISHRFMIKTREYGVDIDGRRLVGITRQLNDTNQNTYGEFGINGTARGNNVLALTDTDDLNNNNTATTIATWDQFANDNEGYIGIDVDADTVNEFYFSSLDIGGGSTPASPTKNDLYEWAKYITRDGSTTTVYGIAGELFRGITHQVQYDTEAGTGPAEGNLLVWGQHFSFDGELAADGTPGEYYDFSISGAKGLLLAKDATTNDAVFAMNGVSAVDNDVVTRSDGTAADGFTVMGTITGSNSIGGAAVVLADDTVNDVWIQLLSGVAPTDGTIMYDATVSAPATPIGASTALTSANSITMDTTITSRTLSFPWIGVSTGTSLIGGYGVGVDTTDIDQTDKLFDLTNTQNSPPNIPTFTVGGLVSAEDRVLVAPWDGVSTDGEGNPAIDVDQLTLNTNLIGAAETAVVVTAAIPTDTPSAGTIRVQLDTGFYRRVPYTSWSGSTFTTASTDWTDPNDATGAANVWISYIDEDASGTSASFAAEYSSDRDLVVLVRDGKTTPIKQFIQSATFGSSSTTVTAIRTTDE